jgi:(p)ppGpp synthase/HD superfamily hydrolase
MHYSYAIEQAIRASAILHKDQVRKGKVPYPYVTHLFAAAMLAADYTDDEDIVVATLLHDTLEDTEYTEAELREDFGDAVADIVRVVTEPPRKTPDLPGILAQKKQYVKQIKDAPEAALIVVAADKIHNMRSVVEAYTEDPAGFLADFGVALQDRLRIYQEISNILNRSLKNAILSEFNSVFTEYKNFILDVEKKRTSR